MFDESCIPVPVTVGATVRATAPIGAPVGRTVGPTGMSPDGGSGTTVMAGVGPGVLPTEGAGVVVLASGEDTGAEV